MKHKVIILTDPGQDQAAAILMMLGMPHAFDVRGIVATAGNIDISHTVKNCLKLLELADRTDIPVYVGSPRPIVRDLVTATHVHGPTGLDGVTLPEPTTQLAAKSGVDFIIDTVRQSETGEITICSLSPLTNLALALVQAPDIAPKIKELVAMAGAYFEVGNITPTAEFNIYVDPEAAHIVLQSGIPITMLPLDVTHQMLSTPERLKAMRAVGSRCGEALSDMLGFSESFDLKKYGWSGAPLHAPCVPTFLLEPGMYSGRQINVSVELRGEFTLGMTVADWWRITDRPKNVFYIREGDSNRFYEILLASLSELP